MTGGLYAIRCTATSEQYVGVTSNFACRWKAHRTALRAGEHNHKLQARWDEHGERAFKFAPLVICGGDYAASLERKILGTPELRESMAQLNVGGPGATGTEKWRANVTATMKRLNADSKFIKARAEGIKRFHADPVVAAKYVVNGQRMMKRFNADPHLVANRSKKLEAFAATNTERLTRLNADPVFAAARIERIKRRNADPVFAAARDARLKLVRTLDTDGFTHGVAIYNSLRTRASKRGVEVGAKLRRDDFPALEKRNA